MQWSVIVLFPGGQGFSVLLPRMPGLHVFHGKPVFACVLFQGSQCVCTLFPGMPGSENVLFPKWPVCTCLCFYFWEVGACVSCFLGGQGLHGFFVGMLRYGQLLLARRQCLHVCCFLVCQGVACVVSWEVRVSMCSVSWEARGVCVLLPGRPGVCVCALTWEVSGCLCFISFRPDSVCAVSCGARFCAWVCVFLVSWELRVFVLFPECQCQCVHCFPGMCFVSREPRLA